MLYEFFDRNSLLLNKYNGKWICIYNKTITGKWGKLVWLIKGRVNAILSIDQVKDWYYYSKKKWVVRLDNICKDIICFSIISDKEKNIKKNKANIFHLIENYWLDYWIMTIDYNNYKLLLISYFKLWLITKEELQEVIIKYFKNQSNIIIKDIYDDLMILEKKDKLILVYLIKHNLLEKSKITLLTNILSIHWCSIKTFLFQYYYREDLLKEYFDDLLKIKQAII